MARLFASLYLWIAVALIASTALLDALFFNAQPPGPGIDATRIALQHAKPDAALLNDLRHSGIPARFIPTDLIAWPAQSRTALAQGQVVTLYDDTHTLLYRQTESGTLIELALAHRLTSSGSWWLYSGSFFALLGVWIALWLRPLWRDLHLVQQAVEQAEYNGTIAPVVLPARSRLSGIAQALTRLSTQVNELLLQHKEMTGAVAHELRTPLARLKFALAASAGGPSTQWQAMSDDVEELDRMVQEMLDYLRTEGSPPELNISVLPLAAISRQLVQKLAVRNERQLTVSVVASEAAILGDAYYIERAIENLLINAYRHARSQVLIDIEIGGAYVSLRVHDDSEGVDVANRDKVFAAFYRPDTHRSRVRGGAGLGLAIVKRIQQWHQGSCFVTDSERLSGAQFVLRYPHNSAINGS